jgi:hypothetical protein
MTSQADRILERANELISDIQEIVESTKDTHIGQFQVHYIGTRVANLIHSTLGQRSGYAEHLRNALKQKTSQGQFNAIAGVVYAFQRDLSDDNLINIRHEVEAIVVTEILTQAKRLASTKGIHPAAAILVASAGIEEFLRSWCDEKSLVVPEKQRSIARFASELRSSGYIKLPDERRIGSWADYRNEAAHGVNWQQITPEIANRLVREVEDFVLEHKSVLG